MTVTLPTETLTRYVVRHEGRVLYVTNEQGAQQLGGELETLIVPTEAAVLAVLAGLGLRGYRCSDFLTWTVLCRDTGWFMRQTGWAASPMSSGGLFAWPQATVRCRERA